MNHVNKLAFQEFLNLVTAVLENVKIILSRVKVRKFSLIETFNLFEKQFQTICNLAFKVIEPSDDNNELVFLNNSSDQ